MTFIDKEILRARLKEAGAVAVGFAHAETLDDELADSFRRWTEDGHHAGMRWIENHLQLRKDPARILPGVRTVVSMAFPYGLTCEEQAPPAGVSIYARGEDYHNVLKHRIGEVTNSLFSTGEWRVCVDSAPLPERYWAWKSGIGYLADNGALTVPGIGPEVFLAELLLIGDYEADKPLEMECRHCGACRRACPTGAMQADGTIDCRRCLSYLTIEHRGSWSDTEALKAMATDAGHLTIFGCDRCIAACPLRNNPDDILPEFHTLQAITELPELLAHAAENHATAPLSQFQWGGLKNSPLRRAGRDGLIRNYLHTLADQQES